jgi:hypothetical protein
MHKLWNHSEGVIRPVTFVSHQNLGDGNKKFMHIKCLKCLHYVSEGVDQFESLLCN